MGKEENKFQKFFGKIFKPLWRDLGPLIYELFVYSFIVTAVWIAGYLTDLVVPKDQQEQYAIYKSLFIKATLVLSGCAALLTIFVRVLKNIRREIDEKEDHHTDDDDPDDKNDGDKSEELPPKPESFDEIEKINVPKKSERKK